MRAQQQQGGPDPAELCADILTWIAADADLLERFWSLSGLNPETVRQASSDPGFVAGVLDFLMNHEPTLLAYCQSRHVDPEMIALAWRRAGGGAAFEGSV